LLPRDFYPLTPAELIAVHNARMTALVEQEQRDWQRAASVMALIANVNRDPKKRLQAYKAEDFMPRIVSEQAAEPTQERQPAKRRMTTEEMLRNTILANRLMGGLDKREQKGEKEEA
jgi:hypothetical protein